MRKKEYFDKTIKKIKRKIFRPIDTIQNENVLNQKYSYSGYILNTIDKHELLIDNYTNSSPIYSITIKKNKDCEDFFTKSKTVNLF